MNLFELLPENARARLEAAAETVRVRPEHYIIRRGEMDGDFYRLESGLLEVVDRTARPELVLRRLEPGSVVGEMAFVDRSARSADVRAASASVLLCWRREKLLEFLLLDPFLATEFYRAISQLLSRRVASLNRTAATGGLAADTENPFGDAAVRKIAETCKRELRAVEMTIRSGGRGSGQIQTTLQELITKGAELFGELEPVPREEAGRLLYNELHPYLGRSRLAGMSQVGAPLSEMLLHLIAGRPAGDDGLGRALDNALQDLPTARAFRSRETKTAQVAESFLPRSGGRVTVIGTGTGKLISGLGRTLARSGGELTCVDNDPKALSRLQDELSSVIRLRTFARDLGELSQGLGEGFLGEQELFVVDGLVEFLPERVFASLAESLLDTLSPGGAAVFNLLDWSDDTFFFNHLLGWPTIRRDAEGAARTLATVGYTSAKVIWKNGPGAVILGRRPEM